MPIRAGLVSRLQTALLAFCLVAGCGMPDYDKHATYANYDEAIADGAKRRGWIRDFVPESAVDIQESHNLDSNTQWMTFRFDPADLDAMKEALTPARLEDVRFHRRKPTRKRPWWPEELLEPSPALEERYDLYTYGADGFVAVEKGRPVVWTWNCRE